MREGWRVLFSLFPSFLTFFRIGKKTKSIYPISFFHRPFFFGMGGKLVYAQHINVHTHTQARPPKSSFSSQSHLSPKSNKSGSERRRKKENKMYALNQHTHQPAPCKCPKMRSFINTQNEIAASVTENDQAQPRSALCYIR